MEWHVELRVRALEDYGAVEPLSIIAMSCRHLFLDSAVKPEPLPHGTLWLSAVRLRVPGSLSVAIRCHVQACGPLC